VTESVMMSGDRRRARDDASLDHWIGHTFKDPGEPIASDPWTPEARAVPEHVLAVACLAEGVDFGGPLSELDRTRLAEMVIVLAETNAALMKRARERDAEKAVRAAAKAAHDKAIGPRACLQCEAAFLPGSRPHKMFCATACAAKWQKRVARGECQPAREAARVPAVQNHPAETDAQAARAATGNDAPAWSARLRDMAARYRAAFQRAEATP
jgi:hypothetical protein